MHPLTLWRFVSLSLSLAAGNQVGGLLTEFGAVGEAAADLEVLRWQCDGADNLLQG